MKAVKKFTCQPMTFWAYVRTITEVDGYSARGQDRVKAFTLEGAIAALRKRNLSTDDVSDANGRATKLGKLLVDYSLHRADVLNSHVRHDLMNAGEAKDLYARLCDKYRLQAANIPVNKQSGDKKTINYMTAIVHVIIAAHIDSAPCDYSPRGLTTYTRDGKPVRTLSRWLDGAFPSIVNPVATWEIKEYYYTTTFGSKVSDAIYVAQLDGMELNELRQTEGIDVQHYLMVDARDNWWKKGKSYLCRIVDMLHMGFASEVLFGREVETRLPVLVKDWSRLNKKRDSLTPRSRIPGAGNEPTTARSTD